MSIRSRSHFLVGLLTVLGCGALAASAREQACTVSQDEQEVYAALLSQSTSEDSTQVVITRTAGFEPEFDIDALLIRDLAGLFLKRMATAPSGSTVFLSGAPPGSFLFPREAMNEIRAIYKKQFRQSCLIPHTMVHLRRVQFISASLETKIFQNFDSEWTPFHQRFGKTATLVSFTRVAFDKTKTVAAVHVSSGIAAMGAAGALYFLTRDGHKWTIQRSFITWVT